MSVRVSGFAKGLVRCLDFATVSVEELDRVLVDAAETLEMDYVEPSADSPFIQSGTTFGDLVFVQHGTAVPWQSPHSELDGALPDRSARVPDVRRALGGQLLGRSWKRSWCGFRRA